MSRAVLFDTETTGLDPLLGHRVIEVAALELLNDLPTGRHFHALIHPDRDIPEDATRIHGFTLADLAGRPRFGEIVDELLEFFGDDNLIAHNAPFDFAFLDAEFGRIGRPALSATRARRTTLCLIAGCWPTFTWNSPVGASADCPLRRKRPPSRRWSTHTRGTARRGR